MMTHLLSNFTKMKEQHDILFSLFSGSSDNLIPAAKLKQPSIATKPQTYRVPAGENADLECRLLNLGDSVQLWKNRTRVISVGSLQVINDPRIIRSEDRLIIRKVNIWDTGTYTCEIEANMDEQTTVSHFLQVLGIKFIITKKMSILFRI